MILSFEISAKEHRVIGMVKMKTKESDTKNGINSIFELVFLMLIDRYECPAGCLDATGKVVGTVYYEMVSV